MNSLFTKYNGVYALCTSAKCIQTPRGLLCYCNVNKGVAVGMNNGTKFLPFRKKRQTYIYSLYSGINGRLLKKETCTGGTWGDCLNRTCLVDPRNPKKAFCLCTSVKTQPWITFQHQQNNQPCPCNNLSGALNDVYMKINKFYKASVFTQ